MGIVEAILLAMAGILLAALAYVLFVPVTVHVDLLIEEGVMAHSSVKAFPFRRTLYPLPPEPEKPPKPERPKKEKEEQPEEKSQFAEKKKYDFSTLNRADIGMLLGVVGEAFKLMGRLLRAPDYYLVANLAGGVEEPDVTGELYGAYHIIRPNLPAAVRVNFAPDYLAGQFRGNISCGLVVTVFGLIKEIVIFIFRIPKIKLFKLYRKLTKGRSHGK